MEPEPKSNVAVRISRLLGVIGIVATIASFGSGHFWLADLASQLRVQYLALVVLAVPLWVRRRSKRTLVLAGITIAANLWLIAPYFVPREQLVTDTRAYRLTVFNVLRTNDEIDATLQEALADDPDFVFLMEVSNDWQKPLVELVAAYPHQKLMCRDDYTGVAFLSRHPWKWLNVVDVPDANPPLDVTFGSGESELRLILTHPLPSISPNLGQARDRQLTTLADSISDDVATVMAGDFNLAPWSTHFQSLLDAGDLDDASMGHGVTPTLTPLPTWFGGVKVDHVLINDRAGARNYRLGRTAFSDHRPISIDVWARGSTDER